MATIQEIKDGYTSTLQDLTCNSKPLISVLTMLAEENMSHAKEIVEAIEAHLEKVRTEVKLPVLYLIDCIIKNVGGPYTGAFCTNLVSLFCNVFQVVDEKTRTEMYKLRQTWNDVIPKIKLYALDVQIKQMDPAWPITAQPPKNIHFNPKFLKTGTPIGKKEPAAAVPAAATPKQPPLVADPATLDMQQKLIVKQKQLLELQQKKLELEVLQAQVKLQEQQLLKKAAPAAEETTKTKTIPQQRLTLNNNAPSVVVGLPKIAPVNSALVAAVRPIRDPRLLRQHNQQNTVNSNQQLDNNKPNNNTTINALDSKLVNSKASARVEAARFLNNKDEPKTKTVSSRIPLKSKRPSSPANNNNKGSSKPNRSSSSNSNKSPSSSGSSSTSSLLDSPTKSKNNSRSSSKSPSKYKKGTMGASSSSGRDGKKSGGNKAKERKSSPVKDNSGFKSIKGLSKSRNYVRRNRDVSPSPEPVDVHYDVDLRVNSGPPEKLARIQLDDKPEKCDVSIQGMDVDLRLTTELGKKRQSLDTPDVPAKKTKSEMFDVLFGNEDVDLRQLPTITSPKETERPPTPPPPIISNKTPTKTKAKNEKENSATSSPKNDSSPKANLDALRVKLANATNQDKMNKSRFSQPEPKWQPPDNSTKETAKMPALDDSLSKIIISPADEECIKTGKMTKAQENALMNKILAQIENQKLKEAKRKDSEENLANISLQPISDDELDSDLNDSVEIIENKNNEVIHIVDDYHPPKHPNFDQRFRRAVGGMPPMWRGNRRGFPMPRGPMRPPRPGVEPWIRPLPPPMNPHWRPPFNNMNNYEEERIHTIDLVDNRSNSPFPTTNETPDLVVNKENTKSITIDGQPRDIIYYDETAIAFMSWENPREITFQNGSRRVFFDDKDSYLLFFNEPYKDIMINGNMHKVRLGAPTREIYIDGKYYECYFGGNGVAIELDGKQTILKMEGPPPQVKIGNVKCTHICAGKINLIIDAKTIVPVYLDAREQKFDIDGKVHTLKFTDALKTVLINNKPFKVEFGGLPKPITVNDKKHFVRFSVLPRDIKPGCVDIKDMEGLKPLITSDNENSQDVPEKTNSGDVENITPAAPAPKKKSRFNVESSSPDRNSNSPNSIQSLLQQPTIGNLDSLLTNVLAATSAVNLNQSSYQIDNTEAQQTQQTEPESTASQDVGNNLQSFNINDLFLKLVATGIVSSEGKSTIPVVPPIILPETNIPPPIIIPPPVVAAEPQVPEVPKTKKLDLVLKFVDFGKPNTLKMRQPALVHALYSGMQCSSCGMRFPPENSLLYSQHLDWHFRQNRRGKKSIRKATSRRWYYSISDWNNYEEIEDLEEREKCYFENQQKEQADGVNEEGEEEIEIPSVPADSSVPDPHCEVCQEKFEQFYNEEKEEWHLRMAVRIEDRTYHPLCYEDYQASLVDVTMEESIHQPETESNVIPGLEILPDDNDESKEEEETPEIIIDDVESIQSVDTPKTDSAEKGDNPEVPMDDDDDDDDVIINEVQPERINLDEYEFKGNVEEDGLITGITIKQEPADDGFTDIENFQIGEVKIKTEPVTPDESFEDIGQVVIPDVEETETEAPTVEPVHPELVTSIDGNVELNAGVPPQSGGLGGKIKINISKQLPQLPVIAPKENKDISLDVDANIEPVDPTQPLPPGEEPVQLNRKPALQGVELKKLPPVNKGSELTGLCSIM